jgi:NitT/TauT family transport system substrate-binding protein
MKIGERIRTRSPWAQFWQFGAAACIGTMLLVVSANAQEMTKLRVGAMPYQDYLSIHIAQRNGWFAEEGVEVEIINLSWYDNINEALAGGSIDMGSSTPDSRLAVYQIYPDAKLAFLAFSFEGFGFIADPAEFKSYDDILAENGGDKDAALRDAMAQAKGRTACYPTTGGSTTFIETALGAAGLTLDDVSIIDLDADEALQAFYADRCDFFMAGIPQRQRSLKDGYIVLVSAGVLPPAAAELVGWAVTDSYMAEHPDAVLGFMRGWYRGMDLAENNPDEAFTIIAEEVNKIHHQGMTVDDLKGAWQVIEFFPNNACEAKEFFFESSGDRYWRAAFDAVMNSYVRQGRYTEPVSPEEIVTAPQVLEMYIAKYGCL